MAHLAGQRAGLTTLPSWTVGILGLVNPVMRELREMTYQFDRPFIVDHSKYARRFGEGFTPLDEGLRATVEWYREALSRG
jgi:hypothetical protein